MEQVDVVVVGAGAAGVGVGVALKHAGIEDLLLLDRHGVGASFDRWPKEMRFITPSFATNSIGMLDINSVAIGTSPAFTLEVEHPTGQEFAKYLRGVSTFYELPVRSGIDVKSVEAKGDRFLLTTSKGEVSAKFVVWAAGEFLYPQTAPFVGAEHCVHNALVDSWETMTGSEAVVIGGYESGVDAAIHLARRGAEVIVLDRNEDPAWESESSDPSVALSTYTMERLLDPAIADKIMLEGGADVVEVRENGQGFEVVCRSGDVFRTAQPPVLATGFHGSVTLVRDLFEAREDGLPLLSEQDESTVTPGLFLCGPTVRHDNHVFCFIFKFRQRFAVVAKTIAGRLGLDAEDLEVYRQWGMYLDDLSCCGEQCAC